MMLEIQNFVKPIKGLLASLVVGMINCWFGMGPGMNISNPAAAGISSITFRIGDQRTFNVRRAQRSTDQNRLVPDRAVRSWF